MSHCFKVIMYTTSDCACGAFVIKQKAVIENYGGMIK